MPPFAPNVKPQGGTPTLAMPICYLIRTGLKDDATTRGNQGYISCGASKPLGAGPVGPEDDESLLERELFVTHHEVLFTS